MANQTVLCSVTGGYNGGAVIMVQLDGVQVYRATGSSPYNLTYNPASATFTTVAGEVTVTPTIANSTSPLLITFTGAVEQQFSVLPVGNNSSWGYNWQDTFSISPAGPGFEIIIQRNRSDNIQLDKELEDLLTVQGILREETSIIDPVLLIECDLAQVTGCNYITIPEFGRSYFVQEIVSVRTGLVEFSCHVDVLSSFAEEIRANTGIVFKSQDPQAYNTYLDDGGLRTYANPFVLTEPFPGGFSGASFVLAVAGSAST